MSDLARCLPGADGVGVLGEVPAVLEDQSGGQHSEEDELLVAGNDAMAENLFREGEHAQREPAGAGDEAVGVPASPEVE